MVQLIIDQNLQLNFYMITYNQSTETPKDYSEVTAFH